MIADVLGAKVYNNKEKEIGFMPVKFLENNSEEIVFHWHGETFDLPERAKLLAFTEGCKNQAYSVGDNILAFQFHPEVTREIVRDMVKHEGHELIPGYHVHSAEKILNELCYLDRNKTFLFGLLDKFFHT